MLKSARIRREDKRDIYMSGMTKEEYFSNTPPMKTRVPGRGIKKETKSKWLKSEDKNGRTQYQMIMV